MSKTVDHDGFVGESLEERLETLYYIAEDSAVVNSSEVNPSFHSLKKVTQRYISPELIATGGLKQIFKVRDARSQRDVAMALLRDDASEDLCDPFIHEAWLTARLDHPNIITIHDVGATPTGRPYFTMDLKKGYSLYELILKLRSGNRKMLSRYPLNALLNIFLKVCNAISYAHSINVIHLDLKPSNIQTDDFGQVMVCDWGLAMVIGSHNTGDIDRMLFNPDLLGSMNLFGQIKGTPGYMAPEQLAENGQLDERTDVFGLGCILYSILTLERPYSGNDQEIMKEVREGHAVPPIQRTPERNIPEGLSAVVMKAIDPDPSKRYASVALLHEEVGRYLTGFAPHAEHAGVRKQLHLFYRRNRRFCIAVAAAGLIIVAGTIASVAKVNHARKIAEDTLALYQAGQKELEIMSSENAESIVELALSYEARGNPSQAEAILLAALEQNPGKPLFLRALGRHFFSLQQFKKASSYLERASDNTVLAETADFFAPLKDDQKILNKTQMLDLMPRLSNQKPLLLIMVLYDQGRRFEIEDRAAILEAYLRIINPEWKDGWFEYDHEASRLRTGGSGLKRLAIGKSVLTGLNLKILDLSGSEITDLGNEKGSAIEVLDIRNTPMDTFWFLRRFVYLRELIITPGQLSKKQRKQLLDRVNVVEKAMEEE